MFPVGDISRPYAMHLVVIDSEGAKIEVSINKNFISKFRSQLAEGNVYIITYFAVSGNNGSFRATEHDFKIFFNGRTRVVPDSSEGIPFNGLTLKNSYDVETTMGESDYLIDIIGLVTAVSSEKKYVKSGNVTRKIELELTDDKGKVKCAFFGNYVDIVKQFIATNGDELPVVVVQFGKIKSFKGDVVIQNVMNATKILWNADIPEVAVFRDGLALHGLDPQMPLGQIDDGVSYVPIEQEFLTMYPKKTISELHSTEEEGIFIVWAKISGVLDGEKWWYTACRCHKSVTVENGLFMCSGCATYVLEVIPRFRIKVDVCDGEENATFLLFDSDAEHLVQKSCKDLVASSKGKSVNEYPDAIKAIVGNECLFKVEKSSDHGTKFDDSFKVKKICDITSVIEMFRGKTKVHTPKKLITKALGQKRACGSKDRVLSDDLPVCSDELSDIRGNVVSLDDISSGEGSSVVSSIHSAVTGDVVTSKPSKRMRIRNIKLDL